MGRIRAGADSVHAESLSPKWVAAIGKKDRPKEKPITNSVLKWLKTLPHCKVIKKHQTEFDERGTPDIMGCIAGRLFVIEMKRPGAKPTPIQLQRLKEWSTAGAVAFWSDNLKHVQRIFLEEGLIQ